MCVWVGVAVFGSAQKKKKGISEDMFRYCVGSQWTQPKCILTICTVCANKCSCYRFTCCCYQLYLHPRHYNSEVASVYKV